MNLVGRLTRHINMKDISWSHGVHTNEVILYSVQSTLLHIIILVCSGVLDALTILILQFTKLSNDIMNHKCNIGLLFIPDSRNLLPYSSSYSSTSLLPPLLPFSLLLLPLFLMLLPPLPPPLPPPPPYPVCFW